MKRRSFFNKLLAGIAGAAIAPRVAAELAKNPETTPPFDKKIVDKRIEELKDYSSYSDQCFFGKNIRWDEKGNITCIVDRGPIPFINDIVMLNILDDHHLPVMAMVTSLNIESNDIKNHGPRVVSMIILDKDDPQRMVDLVNSHQNVIAWQTGQDITLFHNGSPRITTTATGIIPGWIMNLKNEDAFMGICTASAHPEPYRGQPGVFRYMDPRQYPMTLEECYRESPRTTGGIWPYLEKKLPRTY